MTSLGLKKDKKREKIILFVYFSGLTIINFLALAHLPAIVEFFIIFSYISMQSVQAFLPTEVSDKYWYFSTSRPTIPFFEGTSPSYGDRYLDSTCDNKYSRAVEQN